MVQKSSYLFRMILKPIVNSGIRYCTKLKRFAWCLNHQQFVTQTTNSFWCVFMAQVHPEVVSRNTSFWRGKWQFPRLEDLAPVGNPYGKRFLEKLWIALGVCWCLLASPFLCPRVFSHWNACSQAARALLYVSKLAATLFVLMVLRICRLIPPLSTTFAGGAYTVVADDIWQNFYLAAPSNLPTA